MSSVDKCASISCILKWNPVLFDLIGEGVPCGFVFELSTIDASLVCV